MKIKELHHQNVKQEEFMNQVNIKNKLLKEDILIKYSVSHTI